jgi:hypothetical protein
MSLLLVIKITCICLFVEPNYTITRTYICLLTTGFLLYRSFIFVHHVSVLKVWIIYHRISFKFSFYSLRLRNNFYLLFSFLFTFNSLSILHSTRHSHFLFSLQPQFRFLKLFFHLGLHLILYQSVPRFRFFS